ncbi:serine/threonine protein kinase [Bradymonadaceae bacterium TMQ3]|nr:serine/threonine protein kinase [Bradymonadaceae bacterium TMQ3]TXC76304.1 serine/threonine protein kinase [Bradymonadales bacterium TMQ1]
MRLDDLNGRVIAGRFELKDMIGKGGYGAVFEARQLSVDRRCAVKVLLPGRADDHRVEERFRAEARATSRLTHPHTLVLYDFGVDEETGFLFLVTEFLDGQTLDELLELEQTIAPQRAVAILTQVAQSLEDAHLQGLVHRDVKPKNIMLVERAGQRDFVKVIDFGIAKALTGAGEDEGLTQTGTLVGTPQYMAPEQLLGGEVDARSDQYALAVVAYRMLTGRNPFSAATPMETALRHINERALPLRTYCPELRVSQAFEDAILRALEKAPKHRYSSTVAMVEALREALGDTSDAAFQDASESGQRTTEEWPQLNSQVAAAHTRVLDAVDTGQEHTAATHRRVASASAEDGEVVGSGERTTGETGVSAGAPADALAGESGGAGDGSSDPGGATTSEVAASMVIEEVTGDGGEISLEECSGPRVIQAPGAREDTAVLALAESGVTPAAHTERRPLMLRRRFRPAIAAVLAATALLATIVVMTGFLGKNGGASQAAPVVHSPDEARGSTRMASEAKHDALQATRSELQAAYLKATGTAAEEGARSGASTGGATAVQVASSVAEAVERATPRTGTVQVTLIPWGTLYVGRRARGEATRQRLELPAGRHELSLRQHGEVRARQTVDVVAGAHRMVVLEAPF